MLSDMKREFKVFGIGLFIVFVVGFSLLGDSISPGLDASPSLTEGIVVSEETHECQADHSDPGFSCPNARLPYEAENKKLTENCETCPNQMLNGGACPGKYL